MSSDNDKRSRTGLVPDGGTVQTGSSPDGLPRLRDVIATHGLSAKKSLGQNFILDLNLTRRIAREAGPLEGRSVIEIGPGPGGLTRGLLLEGAGQVIAVERDHRCLPALADIAARYPNQLHVHDGDALDVDWQDLLARCGTASSKVENVQNSSKPVIAANLPYGIATALLVGWLERDPWPPWYDKMVLMFQREVAERIVAQPDTKAYGRLAVLAQWRTHARIAITLKPEAFTPPPKVASAVVVFEPINTPQPACSPYVLAKVTAAAFGQRRKMLRQSLKSIYRQPEVLLDRVGISPSLRAENVPVQDFARLALAFGDDDGRGV